MEWDGKLKDFFESNEETKVAVCKLCSMNVSFKTSVINLIQHLALAHREALVKSFPIVISNDEELLDSESIPIIMESDSWSFFETVEGSLVATCTLCQEDISFKSNRSRQIIIEQHLKCKHEEIYKHFITSNLKSAAANDVEENDSSIEYEVVINSEKHVEQTGEEYIIISSGQDESRRSNKSKIWTLYKKIPNTQMAECNLCQANMSYKTTTGNLKTHLRRKHLTAYTEVFGPSETQHNESEQKRISTTLTDNENLQQENSSESECLLEDILNSSENERKKSHILNYFNKIKNSELVKCKLCKNYSLSYNCDIHLQRKHPTYYNNCMSKSTSVSGKLSDSEGTHSEAEHSDAGKVTSDVWKYFEKTQTDKIATCTFCQKNLSYKTTITNLKSHMKRVHPEIYYEGYHVLRKPEQEKNLEKSYSDEENLKQDNNSENEYSDENNILNYSNTPRKNRSIIWNFFQRVENSKLAKCCQCHGTFSFNGSLTNLSTHLLKKHPAVYHKFSESKSASFPQSGSERESGDEEQVKKNKSFDNCKFFDKFPRTKIAIIKMCQDTLSYRSTSANLKCHLKNAHPRLYNKQVVSLNSEEKSDSDENNSDKGDSTSEENTEDKNLSVDNSSAPRKNRSKIWDFFERVLKTKLAVCKLCSSQISFRSTTGNLAIHLRNKHKESYNMYAQSKQSGTEHEKVTTKKSFSKWKFFNRIPNTKVATCILCHENLSYKSTTGNLTTHLKRIHSQIYDKELISYESAEGNDSNVNCSDEENSHVSHDTEINHLHTDENATENHSFKDATCKKISNMRTVWNYFNKTHDNKRATCSLCQINISYKTTVNNLKKHLRKSHPEIHLRNNEILQSSKNNSEVLNTSADNSSEDEDFHQEKITEREDESVPKVTKSNKRDMPCTSINENARYTLQNEHYKDKDFKSTSDRSKEISNVWHYFERNDKTKISQCKFCQKLISYKTTTANLKRHLKCKHTSLYMDLKSKLTLPSKNIYEVYISTNEEQEEVKEIGNAEDSKKIEFQTDPFDSEENILVEPPKKMQKINSINWTLKMQPDEKKYIDRCLLKLITEDFHPLSIVKGKGFQEFVAALNPNYELPTKKTLSVVLAEKYANKLPDSKHIAHRCSSASLTLDYWSSTNMQSFMTVTAHFIDQVTFEFCSVLIQCASLDDQYTAEKIATELLQVANKWELANKIKFVVSDDITKLVSAAHMLDWPHFECYAHKFNLIVQRGLQENSIAEIVKKVQKVVAYFKNFSKSKEMLQEYQINIQQVQKPKSLSLAIPSCWITVCKMLKRFSELQEAVRATLAEINEEITDITTEEWQCIAELVEVLQPFEEAANIMSSEKYLIASKAMVLSSGLYKVCTDLAEKPFSETVINLILKLRDGLSKNFDEMEQNEAIAMCTLLDPRFKHHAFEDPAVLINTKDCVLKKMKLLNNNIDNSSSSATANVNTDASSSLLCRFYSKIASSYQPKMSDTTIDELNRYLSENVVPPTECSLRWWKERKILYPALSKIFVECSNVIVTSIPCERAFSKDGYVLLDRRTQLTTSKVDKIMFLNVHK